MRQFDSKSSARAFFAVALLLSIFLPAKGQQPAQPPDKDALAKLNKEFTELGDDWQKRREFCLTLVDNGTIAPGTEQSTVEAILGSEVVFRKSKQANLSAILHFERQRPGPAGYQQPYKGWFLIIELDSQRRVKNYRFSNVHRIKG